jgi:hypothetical protein
LKELGFDINWPASIDYFNKAGTYKTFANLLGLEFGLDKLLREVPMGSMLYPKYLAADDKRGAEEYCTMLYLDNTRGDSWENCINRKLSNIE